MLKVLLVEDNRVFREAFKQNLCESFPSILIEEAGDSDETFLEDQWKSPPSHLHGYAFARHEWPSVDSKDKEAVPRY